MMNVRALLTEIYRRHRVLAVTGWLHVMLLVVLLSVAPFDARTVTGLNPWIKPMKFAVSITIYLWTLAWFLAYLRPAYPRAVRVVGWLVSLVFVVEMLCVVSQAARGVPSHFNISTPYDGAVFTLMGVMIIINTLLVALVLLMFFLKPVELPPAYLWGIRFGLLLFVLASLEGFVMTSQLAHTVGAADGGPGLPFVNWSTRAGDLRVAHFLGFHALQLLPLAGYWLNLRSQVLARQRRMALVVAALAFLYALVFSALFWQALSGRPLISLSALLVL